MNSVLERFLAEEASPYVRKLIADAVSEHGARPAVRSGSSSIASKSHLTLLAMLR